MINICICDDEPSVLRAISKVTEAAIITTEFDAEIALVTSNQNDVYRLVKDHQIDVLFLDIDFKKEKKNGIDFALDLREVNKDFKLVFITGHFEYAMLAYKCKTFDYILKPVDINKVISIMKRLKEDFSETKFELFKINKDLSLRAKDILFIERNKSKATVYTKDATYETCFSLNSLENELPDSFIRVHRSFIVNSDQISRINKDEKLIYFSDKINCPLGNLKYKEELL